MARNLPATAFGLLHSVALILGVLCFPAGCSPGNSAGGSERPSRPSKAFVGQWKVTLLPSGNNGGNWYFKPGQGDNVLLTTSGDDGAVDSNEFGVFDENTKSKTIELRRWYSKERGDTKKESHYAQGGGGMAILRCQFSDDMKTIRITNNLFGDWEERIRLEYVGGRLEP